MATTKKLIRNYEISEKIGSGTFGRVYRVKDVTVSGGTDGKSKQEYFALKEIDLRNANSKEKECVQREQSTMKSYSHANIVTFRESFFKDNYIYIVMELCTGGTIYSYLKEKGCGMSEIEFVHYLKEIINGVQFLHENKVIHRDLKTKNLLLSEGNNVKIADFGVARSISPKDIDNLSKFVGTVHYMSPEMISGNPDYNEKTDIWSLGCTCYEMGTGKYAFDGQNISRIKMAVQKGQLYDVDKMEFCDEIKDLILSMLHTNPHDRPSAAHIKDVLGKHHCPNTTHTTELKQLHTSQTIPGSPLPHSGRREPLGMSDPPSRLDARLTPSYTSRDPPSQSDARLTQSSTPRDRRRRRISSICSDSSTVSSSSVPVGKSINDLKKVLKQYKCQSKHIQTGLLHAMDDYKGAQWVSQIQDWCKKMDCMEDIENKARDLLQKKPNLYDLIKYMVLALKEIENGVKLLGEEIRQKRNNVSTEEEEDEDTISESSSVHTLDLGDSR